MKYSLYYPEEGRYSRLLSLAQARCLAKQFPTAIIVDMTTAEVIDWR